MPPMMAIVGRANVGKSTLVNRLVGKRAAIEHPEPGVTRDARGYDVRWAGTEFTVVDTGGWEPRARGLSAKIVAQAERAAGEADLIVMVVDAQTGVTADDLEVAKRLRRSTIPVMVVANKVDDTAGEAELDAIERLGLGPAMPVSALHGRGSGDFLDVAVEHLRAAARTEERRTAGTSVAIVGRPNVGKSSLFNRLTGDDRAIVHDMPGTTRDTIDSVVELEGHTYRFIDTAGMRKRAREASGPEYYGLLRSLRAIDSADIALHIIDAIEGPTEQDQRIARRVSDAGCAAVLVLNKWDLVDAERVDEIAEMTRAELRFVPWATLVRTSATTGRGLMKIAPALASARDAWEQRIPTGVLNSWAREATDTLKLGSTKSARPTRLRYITQSGVRPPTFVVFANGRITTASQRAIENRIRARFGFEGTPIRILVRGPKPRAGTG